MDELNYVIRILMYCVISTLYVTHLLNLRCASYKEVRSMYFDTSKLWIYLKKYLIKSCFEYKCWKYKDRYDKKVKTLYMVFTLKFPYLYLMRLAKKDLRLMYFYDYTQHF